MTFINQRDVGQNKIYKKFCIEKWKSEKAKDLMEFLARLLKNG